MRISIIGTGLMCRRRAPVILDSDEDVLVSITGRNIDASKAIATKYACEFDDTWQDVIQRDDVDVVIIATPPNSHHEITIAALRSGKHVLCEKPLSMNVEEALEMMRVAEEVGKVLKCGFNHRYHPAIWEAKKKQEAGHFGKILFARCRYGICGRPDYGTEWRADPNFAAGGQLIEQGSHGFDLIRWFMGEIDEVSCMNSIHYFDDQQMEDDGMVLLRAKSGATAMLHTTLVQWQNLFSLEIFGSDGYARVEGLGGGYGTEKLFLGKRDFEAPFQDNVIQYRGGDISWKKEWADFKASIDTGSKMMGDSLDGVSAMKISEAAYASDAQKKVIKVL